MEFSIVASNAMDNNSKRDESKLLRISAAMRDKLGLSNGDYIEVRPLNTPTMAMLEKRKYLQIFSAFSADVKSLNSDNNVGFVKSEVLKHIGSTEVYIIDKNKVSDHIVIGADPEFLLIDDKSGNIINANSVPDFEEYGPIGWDGAMGEIRPDPALNSDEFIRNIKCIFENKVLTKAIDPYKWIATCYGLNERPYFVGGHLHFDNGTFLQNIDKEHKKRIFEIHNKMLDEYLALPFIRIDGRFGGIRRCANTLKAPFGFFGGLREAGDRLEYRTLSGMWLMHPSMTKLVFDIAQCVSESLQEAIVSVGDIKSYIYSSESDEPTSILNNTFSRWSKIGLAKKLHATMPNKAIISMLNESLPDSVDTKFIKTWYNKIQRLSKFTKYEESINRFKALIEIPLKNLNLTNDIKDNWLHGEKFIDE